VTVISNKRHSDLKEIFHRRQSKTCASLESEAFYCSVAPLSMFPNI
jgi:hypothetical protein